MKVKLLLGLGLLYANQVWAQSLYDDFNGTTVNASIWNTVLPFGQSQISEFGGYLTTTGRGTLETVAGFASPYAISGTVTLNNPDEHFEVTMRSNLQPGYQSTDGTFYDELTGVKVEFSGDGQEISIQEFTPSAWYLLADVSYPISVGQPYDFEITDTGSDIALSVNGNDLLSAATSYATGNQIALQSREFSNTSSSLDFVQITPVPEPSGMALLGLGAGLTFGIRKCQFKT
jgi:hypothetical protein